mgnify:CR=1 FL=1
MGADVADAAAVSAAAEKILAECAKVDVLVNNAGVTRDGLLMRMSEEDWDAVLTVNPIVTHFVDAASASPVSRPASPST